MTKRFAGDRAALTALRLRLLVRFLWSHGLYDTFHALSRETGAFFRPSSLELLMMEARWDDALAYVTGFVVPGTCSREADLLAARIRILGVMRRLGLGDGETSAVAAALDRLGAAHPDCHDVHQLLLSLRHDKDKASRLYQGARHKEMKVIMKLAANCPELNSKLQLPRCEFNPTYIMSLGPRLWDRKRAHKNVAAPRIPAHVLARSFLRNRSNLLTLQEKNSGLSLVWD